MTARELVVRTFQATGLEHLAVTPDPMTLGLMLSLWLHIGRPRVWLRVIDHRRHYKIVALTEADAQNLVDHFGGERIGCYVKGFTVDLTS